jgi:hypothetical protein
MAPQPRLTASAPYAYRQLQKTRQRSARSNECSACLGLIYLGYGVLKWESLLFQ